MMSSSASVLKRVSWLCALRPTWQRRTWFALVGFLCANASVLSTLSAQEPVLEIERITGEIVIDGELGDPGWQRIQSLPLTMYAPTFRGTPAERTEIRVAYDDENLYAAAWFYDKEPEGIRINSLYRDRWNGDDAFAIYVDAFNDNRNAKWFGTTPAGIRFDVLVSDDGRTLNSSWDTFWEAESRVTEEGWFAEVKIPFSSLGFQADDDGRAVMGLTVTRLVSRTGERVTFPVIDPRFAFRQPSKAQDVVLRDVRSPAPLYLTPYLLAGVNQRPVLMSPDGVYRTDTETARQVGLDVRYPLSSVLTLDATVNTDFAQVEADDQQINLDRFPLFFPEKRRFFQEGSGLFDFTTGGNDRLFHSRRIGLTAGREPAGVFGGARLVGRIGDWDVGALNMTTRGLDSTPGENFGVARVRRRVLNEYSTLGAMVTTRTDGGTHNVALGADADIRMIGDHYLTTKLAMTASDDNLSGVGLFDRSVVDVRWQRRASHGLGYNVDFTRVGESYQPDVGFLSRRNVTSATVFANYYMFTDDHPLLRRVLPGLLAFSIFRNSDGALESGQYAVWVQWDTKSGGGGWIEPKVFHENVLSPFSLGGEAGVPAGVYTFADLQVNLSMATGRQVRTDLDFRSGTYFDGTRTRVQLLPTWNVSAHVEVGGQYSYSRIRFPARGEGVDIHEGRLRIRTALNAELSGNAFLQYNSTLDRVDMNVRLRYNIAEGTDLWVAYNEGVNTDADLGTVPGGIPRTAMRSLIVKYSHTLVR